MGVLYVGTTDGAIWATRDGGHAWTNLYGKREETEAHNEETGEETGDGESKPSAEEPKSTNDRKGEATERPVAQTDSPIPRGRGVFSEMMRQRDANADGKLQRSEMTGRAANLFERLDANEDGVVDEQELVAMSQRGRNRGGRDSAERQRSSKTPSAPPKRPAAPAKKTAAPQPIIENDIVSGSWEGRFESENMPPDRATFALVLRMTPQGTVTGSFKSQMSEGEGDGKFDPEKKEVVLTVDTSSSTAVITGTLSGTEIEGNVDVSDGAFVVPFKAKRTGPAPEVEKSSEPAQGKSLKDLIPGPRWVSSIEASKFKNGRVYLTCDGHRSNDDNPYVLVSEDYGQTWRSLRANLPPSIGTTRVIREDVKNQNVLFLGTEFSIWISIDRGESWTKLNSNLPTVSIHEIAIHPTAGEIVAATHGRSLWILDVAALRQLSAESIAAKVSLYQPQPAVKWRSQPRRGSAGTRQFTGSLPSSGATITYSLAKDAGSVYVTVTDIEGQVVRELEGDRKAGLHSVNWDLRQVKPTRGSSAAQGSRRGGTVASGKYLVTLFVDDQQFKKVLTVEDDPDASATGK